MLSACVDLSGFFDAEDRFRVVDLRGRPAPERRGVPGMGAMVIQHLRVQIRVPDGFLEISEGAFVKKW